MVERAGRTRTGFRIVIQHLAHFLFGEARQFVEHPLEGRLGASLNGIEEGPQVARAVVFAFVVVQTVGVRQDLVLEPVPAMRIQRLPVAVQFGVDHRKVQSDDQVRVAFGRRMLPDIEVAKPRFEVVFVQHVVVTGQHVHRQTLAEAARTDEEEKLVGSLNGWNKGSFLSQPFAHALLHQRGLA